MNSQPNRQLLELSRKTGPVESFATICVSIDNANTILPFLFKHQIPFIMSSGDFSAEIVPDKKITAVLVEEPKITNPIIKSRIEQVFQKYFNEGATTIPPSLEVIAEEAGVSVSVFKSIFKKMYGTTLFHYSIEKKMEYAAELLIQGLKATEVSDKLGYTQPIKFNKMFQKYFGVTPHKYRIRQLMLIPPSIP